MVHLTGNRAAHGMFLPIPCSMGDSQHTVGRAEAAAAAVNEDMIAAEVAPIAAVAVVAATKATETLAILGARAAAQVEIMLLIGR